MLIKLVSMMIPLIMADAGPAQVEWQCDRYLKVYKQVQICTQVSQATEDCNNLKEGDYWQTPMQQKIANGTKTVYPLNVCMSIAHRIEPGLENGDLQENKGFYCCK